MSATGRFATTPDTCIWSPKPNRMLEDYALCGVIHSSIRADHGRSMTDPLPFGDTPSHARDGDIPNQSRKAFDNANDLVLAVAVPTRKAEQLTATHHYLTQAWSITSDRDTTSPPELQQALISQLSKRPEHGVLVDTEDRCHVTCRRKSLSRLGLTFGDVTT